MSTISLSIPESLYAKARELADKEKTSLNELIIRALAEKITALMPEEYLIERARRGDRGRFERAMAKAADVEPEDEDRL